MLFDVTRLVKRCLQGKLPTGVDRVGIAYLSYYLSRADILLRWGGLWWILCDRVAIHLVESILSRDLDYRRLYALLSRQVLTFPRQHFRDGLLLNVMHSGLESPTYASRIQRMGLRSVYMVHDLIPLTHPEYARPREQQKHQRRVLSMQAASGLIFNSHDTARTFTHYAAKSVYPPSIVAPLAAPELPQPSPQRPLSEPYFVVLGTIEPRKNHLLLLHVWRRLTQMVVRVPKLVVIGRRGWECEQVVDLLERGHSLRGHVFELPFCEDAELATWLKHAQALLFPSFTEGYGLPLIEALAMGTPAIVSDLPVFHEVAADVPEYLDPLDGPQWLRAVLDYAENGSARRHAQIERLQHWRAPSWAEHFKRVDAFLDTLI